VQLVILVLPVIPDILEQLDLPVFLEQLAEQEPQVLPEILVQQDIPVIQVLLVIPVIQVLLDTLV
jgi:hypothetical protein